MRVKSTAALGAHDVHWRGIALTTFDGRRWFNEPHEPIDARRPGADGWFHLGLRQTATRPGRHPAPLHRFARTHGDRRAFLWPPNRNSVRGRFTDEAAHGDQQRAPHLPGAGQTGSLFNPFHNFTRGCEYERIRSSHAAIPPAICAAGSTIIRTAIRETYLAAAARSTRASPPWRKQITARATQSLRQGARHRDLSAHALRLHAGPPGPPQADPLAYFLFQKRAGHCEYFAAAMTVMLRTLGIPARYINGFLPGEYNDRRRRLHRPRQRRAQLGRGLISRVRLADVRSHARQSNDDRPPGFIANLGMYLGLVPAAVERVGHQLRFPAPDSPLAQKLQRVSRDWADAHARRHSRARGATPPTSLKLWQDCVNLRSRCG